MLKRFFLLFLIIFAVIAVPTISPTVFAEENKKIPLDADEWAKGVVVVVYGSQYGTGFWINPSHIATAAHVVGYNPHAQVSVIRGEASAQGIVVALDSNADVAVIQVSNADRFSDKYIFKIARNLPEVGSTIYVIGYPSELLQIMGSIESMSENPRVLRSSLTWAASGLLELGGITDAGNSGGPVVDSNGNVIGLVSFALVGEAGTLYFATSAGNLKQLCDAHNIAYSEGLGSILPDNPALAGAIAGASASVLTDVIILLAGVGLGLGIVAARRRRR